MFWLLLHPSRGVSQAFWQQGPEPLWCSSGPSPCMGIDHAGDD